MISMYTDISICTGERQSVREIAFAKGNISPEERFQRTQLATSYKELNWNLFQRTQLEPLSKEANERDFKELSKSLQRAQVQS